MQPCKYTSQLLVCLGLAGVKSCILCWALMRDGVYHPSSASSLSCLHEMGTRLVHKYKAGLSVKFLVSRGVLPSLVPSSMPQWPHLEPFMNLKVKVWGGKLLLTESPCGFRSPVAQGFKLCVRGASNWRALKVVMHPNSHVGQHVSSANAQTGHW